jgi:hypothetical protein
MNYSKLKALQKKNFHLYFNAHFILILFMESRKIVGYFLDQGLVIIMENQVFS